MLWVRWEPSRSARFVPGQQLSKLHNARVTPAQKHSRVEFAVHRARAGLRECRRELPASFGERSLEFCANDVVRSIYVDDKRGKEMFRNEHWVVSRRD